MRRRVAWLVRGGGGSHIRIRWNAHSQSVVAVTAIVAGIVALLLVRRLLKLPCPGCGTNLYGPIRATLRSKAPLPECPECGNKL